VWFYANLPSLTFEHRRTVYVDFYLAMAELHERVLKHATGHGDDPKQVHLPDHWDSSAYDLLSAVKLYGSPSIAESAVWAWAALTEWGASTRIGCGMILSINFFDRLDPGNPSYEFWNTKKDVDQKMENLRAAIREDLRIPGD
jgi:hypothetical protein